MSNNEKTEKEYLMQMAMEECHNEERSIEYMIQYMQDVAQAEHDEVIDFLFKQSQKEFGKEKHHLRNIKYEK